MTEKITLLIIDNDKDSCDLIQRSLSSDLYNIILTGNDASALDIFEDVHPDLIILDVLLSDISDIDGYETCRRIRQMEMGKHVPLIFITFQDDMESINLALRPVLQTFF